MSLHRTTRRFGPPLAGAPASRVQAAAIARVALLGADYRAMLLDPGAGRENSLFDDVG